jgi:hypothetical protein
MKNILNIKKHINFLKLKYPEIYSGSIKVLYENYVLVPNDVPLDKLEHLFSMFGKSNTKKLYYILIELIQNILRHKDDEQEKSILIIHKKDDIITFTTGNIVSNDRIKKLTNSVDYINSLDREGLIDLYMDVLNNKGFSEKGGAGLGLIEISKKINTKIIYVIKKINEKYSYIYIIINYKIL